MKRYSVLLLYPDYIASTFGQETYLSHVMAEDAHDAISQAQKEALNDNPDYEDASPDDFFPLLVCEKWIEDTKP